MHPLHAVLLAALQGTELPEVLVERDDTEIRASCRLRFPADPIADANGDGVVWISADGMAVDFQGQHLRGAPAGADPDTYSGIGVRVTGKRVAIANARISGYRGAIFASGADELLIEGCDLSDNFRQRLRSTAAAEDEADWLWPHENDQNQWFERWGAALWIEDASAVTVRRCRARAGQNGIVLDRVSKASVYDNDFSFLSGWGLALWRSSDNVVAHNAFDFCVRGYSHGVYNRGQDSAGILLFEQCCRNVFAENSATHCGDGVFGFAGREALGEVASADPGFSALGKGCNENLFLGNDLSYAAAHGLELTFSFRNRIEKNRFEENAICGIWAGYARESDVVDNVFVENGRPGNGAERGAINAEHARRLSIARNEFRRNAVGVRLWWDEDAGLAGTPWAKANGMECDDNWIADNRFERDEVAIELDRAAVTRVARNSMTEVSEELRGGPVVAAENEPIASWTTARDLVLPGTTHPVGARPHLRGRDKILMTRWGPYDGERPLLVLSATDAVFKSSSRSAHVWKLLGPEALVDAQVVGEVRAEVLRTRDGPSSVLVEPLRRGEAAPYELCVRTATAHLVERGMCLTASWTARFFAWTVDPREDAAAWREQGRESAPVTLSKLHLTFGTGGPNELAWIPAANGAAALPHDRFGCLAETKIRLPAGRWKVTATSDDGVRVLVDGRAVIENWTWHVPTIDRGEFDVAEPREVAIAVEHFELDGYAVLKIELEPVVLPAQAPSSK